MPPLPPVSVAYVCHLVFAEEDLPVISFTRTDIQARDDDNCNVEFKASVSHFTNSLSCIDSHCGCKCKLTHLLTCVCTLLGGL